MESQSQQVPFGAAQTNWLNGQNQDGPARVLTRE